MIASLASLASGGILGLVGSALTNIFGYFKEKQKLKQQIAMKQLSLEELDKVHEFQLEGINVESVKQLQISADNIQSDSYGHDSVIYSKGINHNWFSSSMLVLIDFFRASIRPALTIFLIWQVHSTQVEVRGILEAAGIEGLSIETSLNIYNDVVQMILFLASTATCWWFGSRPPRGEKSYGVPKRSKE